MYSGSLRTKEDLLESQLGNRTDDKHFEAEINTDMLDD